MAARHAPLRPVSPRGDAIEERWSAYGLNVRRCDERGASTLSGCNRPESDWPIAAAATTCRQLREGKLRSKIQIELDTVQIEYRV
jgi:hypothetical protein